MDPRTSRSSAPPARLASVAVALAILAAHGAAFATLRDALRDALRDPRNGAAAVTSVVTPSGAPAVTSAVTSSGAPAVTSTAARADAARDRAVRAAVADAWAEGAFAPRFVEEAPPHRATRLARDVVAALAAAPERGLDPAPRELAAIVAALDADRGEGDAARLEATLAFAWGRFLSHSGSGRIAPAALGYDLPARRIDGPPLRAALRAADVAAAIATVEPALPTWRPLVDALRTWRARAAAPAPAPLPPLHGGLAPGDAWAGVDALRARLALEGDLVATASSGDPRAASEPGRLPEPRVPRDPRDPRSPAAGASPSRYDGPLVDAVRRFQARHGLAPDGVIGPRTIEALEVPAARRVRQIELTLERLRWLGTTPSGRYVAVNIPEFRLWAVEGGRAALSMAVVVGRAVSATPVFTDAIEAVELNPYWNVPRSIASAELYPKLARDPRWLAAERMELVGGPAGADLRAALASGTVRMRQKPGGGNALGRVKFRMPNAYDVYLHDTPARTLFERSRRDFSHGCIRLQDPLGLAEWVLSGTAGWRRARIDEAVAEGVNRSVGVAPPVPVLIFYATANVGDDGRIRVLPDVYGHDARLDAALRAAPR